jgi:hypothetical protein
MKPYCYWIVLILPIFISFSTFSQTSFVIHTIDPDFDGAASVFASDINGDSHLDVLSAAAYDGMIAWYESDGNMSPGFTKHIVDDTFDNGLFVYADTINGDTLPDILGASWDGHEIALWIQDGNNPIGWNKQIIDDAFAGAHEVKAADIDGDGHLDVVAAGAENHQIAWWHNSGEDSITWTKHIIRNNAYGARSVFPVDIDFDGDMDILAAVFSSDDMLLFVNDGENPVHFDEVTIDANFDGAHWVHAQDMDNDGDLDVLGAAYMCADIAIWYNDGQMPAGWTKFTVDDHVPGALSVVTGDFDQNGLMDVVGAGEQAGEVICWFQQDTIGPVFVKEIVDGTLWGAWPVYACDLDADDDMDIVASSSTIDDVRWYENTLPTTSVNHFVNPDDIKINLFPNPMEDLLNIDLTLIERSTVSLQIVSNLGMVIRTLFHEVKDAGTYRFQWDGRNDNGQKIPHGIYFSQININGALFHKSFVVLR